MSDEIKNIFLSDPSVNEIHFTESGAYSLNSYDGGDGSKYIRVFHKEGAHERTFYPEHRIVKTLSRDEAIAIKSEAKLMTTEGVAQALVKAIDDVYGADSEKTNTKKVKRK